MASLPGRSDKTRPAGEVPETGARDRSLRQEPETGSERGAVQSAVQLAGHRASPRVPLRGMMEVVRHGAREHHAALGGDAALRVLCWGCPTEGIR